MPSAPKSRHSMSNRNRRARIARWLTMAVPTHFRVDAARALPATGVGIAAISADFVTANAVGGRPLVVAARAQENVAPRGGAVKTARVRVVADPTWRMWV